MRNHCAANQLVLKVVGYDEGNDTFHVTFPDSEDPSVSIGNCFDTDDCDLPAAVLSQIVNESDEPTNFVGRTFVVTFQR